MISLSTHSMGINANTVLKSPRLVTFCEGNQACYKGKYEPGFQTCYTEQELTLEKTLFRKEETRRDFMRALVRRETGLVFDRNYPMPAPGDGEALIHVLLAGICNTDLEITRGYLDFQGVPGHEFVGVVEEVYGDDVAQEQYGYLIGQRIVGEINAACHRPDCCLLPA